MEYDRYEKDVLSEFKEVVMFKAKCIDYDKDRDGYKTLKFFNEDKTKVLACITAINNQFQLFLNDKPVKMMTPILMTCQEVLLKYEDLFKRMPKDISKVQSPKDIIANEQKRDIYKYRINKNPYKQLNVTNLPKPEIIICDTKDTKIHYWYHSEGLRINSIDKKQARWTKRLFLDRNDYDRLDFNVLKSVDGSYKICVRDYYGNFSKTFDGFQSEYGVYRFGAMLLDKDVMPLPKTNVPRIFIKCKIR